MPGIGTAALGTTSGGGSGGGNSTIIAPLGSQPSATSVSVVLASDQVWTGASNLGSMEDAPHASGDVGIMALAVRADTPVSSSGTVGDYSALLTDANGTLYVNNAYKLDSTNDSITASNTTGNVSAGGTDSGNPVKVGGVYSSTKPTLTTGQRGDLQLGTRGALITQLSGSDNTTAAAVSSPGDNQAGAAGLNVISQTAVFNATNWYRALSIINATNTTGQGIMAAGILAQFDDVSPTAITENQFGNVRMSANRNLYGTIRDAAGNERGLNITAQSSAQIEGGTASGSSLVAAPITGGGLAKTANPTAVTDGQVVNSLHDKLGKQVVVGSIRDLKGRQTTTITASTSETTIVTQVASIFLDIYRLVLTNTSATVCLVTIKDSTAGTTVDIIEVPANDTRGWSGPESGSANQTTVNNNWTATCGTSVSSIIVTAYYVKNI